MSAATNHPVTDLDWLPGLADEINAEHAAAEESARDAVNRAYRAGKLLIQAKRRVDHGKWLSWIDENLDLSERTAQTYMRVASKLPTLPVQQAEHVKELTLQKVVTLLREPRKAVKSAAAADLAPNSSDDPSNPPSTDTRAAVTPLATGTQTAPPHESDETAGTGGNVSVVLERMTHVFNAHLEDDAPLWEEWGRLSDENKHEALSAIYSRIKRVLELHRRLSGGQ